MANILRTLLDAKEPMFTRAIHQLETMTRHQATDVAYIADITARAHAVMRRLGLDPADTTEQELYRTLEAHAKSEHLFVDTDDVGLVFGRHVVSFNHEDVLANSDVAFADRTKKHLRAQLKRGLTARYVNADGDNEMAINEVVDEAGINILDMEEYHEHAPAARPRRRPRILCVGDIFTDVFINLCEDEARVDTDKDGSRRLSMPFGTKPPYERADIVRSVGPAPNAAVAMAKLGVEASLESWLGDDAAGKASLEQLSRSHVDSTLVKRQARTASSTYYVLRYKAERTILVKNEAYDYRWRAPKEEPDWIYLSLISKDSWQLHRDLLQYLDAHPSVKLAFQPGTFHFAWGVKKLARIYRRADILVLNREEAMQVTGKPHAPISGLIEGLHALGPSYVVVTDGADGSYASHDGKVWRVSNYPDPAKPLDRTGAGDAFASTIVAALALGEPFAVGLSWAPINSMSVVQKLGAQEGLLERATIQKLLDAAPSTYKTEEYTE